MNKLRRKTLGKIQVDIATAIQILTPALSELEDLQAEEEQCYDNMPEGLRESEMVCTLEENVDKLSDAVSSLDTAINDIIEVQTQLEEI